MRFEGDWTSDLIGVPYRAHGRDPATGWDCWGLAHWNYDRELAVHLPKLDGEEYADPSRGSETLALRDPIAVDFDFRAVDGPRQPGDILWIRMGRAYHVALAIDEQWALHVLPGRETVRENFTRTAWKRRIERSYRHFLRAEN